MYLLFAGEHKLADNVKAKTRLDFKDQIHSQFSFDHKFDKNLRFIYSESIYLDTLPIPDWSKARFNFGVKMEYSL